MPKALVFGSEGFVGPYLVKELADAGWEVFTSDRLPEPSKTDASRYLSVDLTSADQVKAAVDKIKPEAVVNLAAVSSVGLSWKIPQATFEVNVVGAINVLEAVRQTVPECAVLLVGSGEAYAPSMEPHVETDPLDASSPYGISKATQDQFAELYAKRYGMRVLRARPFNHTGVGQPDTFVIPSWCKQAAEIKLGLREPVMRVGNIDVERDFSDVRDVVRAYRLIIEQGTAGEVYNIGSGVCMPLREVLQTIISLSGVDVQVEIDSDLFRPADNPRSICDATRLILGTGWSAVYNVNDTFREMMDFFN